MIREGNQYNQDNLELYDQDRREERTGRKWGRKEDGDRAGTSAKKFYIDMESNRQLSEVQK